MRGFKIASGLGVWGLALVALGQTAGPGGNVPQIPFGQTYKDFEFPLYQNGSLSYTLSAVSAKGLTVNRAETTDLKIDIYTAGKVTTTITSPKADLYVNERKMRTKNTVKVDREDMTATAQNCDFDLVTKKYLMRENVRVVLKHFDAGTMPKKDKSLPSATAAQAAPDTSPSPAESSPGAMDPRAPHGPDSLLDMPGAYATPTNAPTAAPANP